MNVTTMNLYEMLFPGGRDRAVAVLKMLGGFRMVSDAGRPKDGWIERDPEHGLLVRLMTRNGGGNRPDYVAEISRLQAHPLFVRDADSPFDKTYASFWFRLPVGTNADDMAMLEEVAVDPVVDDKRRWDEAMGRHIQLLKDPAQARHPGVAASKKLMDDLASTLDPDGEQS